MTLEQFAAVTAARIPTAPEMVSFAHAQKWRFDVTDGRAVLHADPSDPLVLAFAKMLSREPYRTNVLAHLAGMGAAHLAKSAPPEPAPAETEDESAGTHCDTCSATVYTTSPEVQRMCHRIACPLWTEGSGVGPEWMAKERSAAAYRNRR